MYKPKDKASVENAVSTAYTRLYAPLRNQTFHSLAEVNAGLGQQLVEHQNRDFQNREGTRLSCFTEHELPLLGSLPTAPFLLKKTVRAKVQRNYHVMLGECKNFYSVPFQHVGQRATVVYSRDTVEIFVGPDRVAIHMLGLDDLAVAKIMASDNARRFDGDHWEPGPHGLPILKGVTAWMVGTIVARTAVADNAMIAVQIEEGALGEPDEPLLYHERAFRALGEHL